MEKTRLRVQLDHIRSIFQIRQYFKNPWLIILFRLGIIEAPYFLHRIKNGNRSYAMLARPTTTSVADLYILREVLVDEGYRDVLSLLPRGDIRMLDIGANLGAFTIWLHRTLGVRESFCFEPEPDSFRLLRFNLSLNGCDMAKPLEFAMGGENRTVRIALKKSSPGGTNIYTDNTRSPQATPVPVVAFEDWLRGVEGTFDLLKMDCESSEWEILLKTDPLQFIRFRALLAEVHDDPERKHQISDFKPLAEKLGFRTIRWDNKCMGLYIGVRDQCPGA